jgi:hypothetical protein
MDPRSFDHLARLIGSGRSRRQLLKTLSGGALGAAMAGMGLRASAAASKRSVGNACRVNADCASDLCVSESRTRKICRCAAASDCPLSGDPCATAVCNPDGTCGVERIADGIACGVSCCAADQFCAGDVCVAGQGTCPAGANACQGNFTNCNANGQCYCRTSSEGDTRCGGAAPGGGSLPTCGECGSSAECATLYPGIPGVFCVMGIQHCCTATAPRGICTAPCPTA